jgi:hypothetical protein
MAMTFSTLELKTACMADGYVMNKLTVIRESGMTYGTPGPKCLDNQAHHAHVTGQIGVAWLWTSATDVTILALGKKHNRQGGGQDSGYDWNKKGKV